MASPMLVSNDRASATARLLSAAACTPAMKTVTGEDDVIFVHDLYNGGVPNTAVI
jgi:hypothetical protein